MPIALLTGGRARIVSGVLEVHGPGLAWSLDHVPLIAGAFAITFGHVVLGRNQQALDQSRPHERVHVRQCERWGPFFLPAYLLSSLVSLCRGRSPYRDNMFEREAYGDRDEAT